MKPEASIRAQAPPGGGCLFGRTLGEVSHYGQIPKPISVSTLHHMIIVYINTVLDALSSFKANFITDARFSVKEDVYREDVYMEDVYWDDVYREDVYREDEYREDVYREDENREDVYREDVYREDVYMEDVYREDVYREDVYREDVNRELIHRVSC